MKKLFGVDISGSIIFTPGVAGVGTIQFVGQTLLLNQILLITNVTKNEIIYNFADSTIGVTSYANNILTLDANTSTHSSTDVIQAFVDVEDAQLSVVDRTDNLLIMLSRIVKILESNAVVDQQQRQRITLDTITAGVSLPTVAAVTTVSTVSTVSAVTNMVSNAGMDREQYINIAKQTYTQSIRNRLEFT